MPLSPQEIEELDRVFLGKPAQDKKSIEGSIRSKVDTDSTIANVGQDMARAAKSRSLGVMQLMNEFQKYNPGAMLFDAVMPESVVEQKNQGQQEMDATMSDVAGNLQQERDARGLSGVVGGVLGDPLTYNPLGKVNTFGQAIGKGALFGGAAGATDALTEEQSRLKSTGVGVGVGAAAGGAIKAGEKLVSKAGDAAGGAWDLLKGKFSDDAAANNAYRTTAKTLSKSGVDEYALRDAARQAKSAGTDATLPEFTGNKKLLNRQKYIAKIGDEGSDIINDFVEKRANETIPNRLIDYLEPVANKQTEASRAYTEFFDATDNLQPIDLEPVKKILAVKINTSNAKGIKRGVYESMLEKVDEAVKQGASPRAIQELKDELGLVIDQTAKGDIAVKNKLNRDAVNVVQALTKQADDAFPEFARLRADYGEGKAATDVLKDLYSTQVGSTQRFYNKVYGTPELRSELRKSMAPEDFNGLRNILKSLEQIKKGGLTGSDTAFNQATGEELARESGSVVGRTMQFKTNPIAEIGFWIDDKIRGRQFKELAKLYTNPDLKRLADEISKVGAKSKEGQLLLEEYAVKATPLLIEARPEQPARRILPAATKAATEASGGLTDEEIKILDEYYSINNNGGGNSSPPATEPLDLKPLPETKDSEAVIDGMIKSESGGNPNADNPNSSASGILQYTDDTWTGAVKNHPELGLSVKDKNKPDAQKKMTEQLINKEYEPALKKAGIDATPAAIYAMHHFGQEQALRLLKRKQSKLPAANLVSKGAVKANKNVFFDKDGKPRTAAQVYAWLDERIRR